MIRAGIDIGGTFTDFVVVDDQTDSFYVTKRLTTSHDPSEAFLEGLDFLLRTNNISYDHLGYTVHGTTLGSNTLIERSGAKTALITTRGFRDVLLIGRQKRYDIYDLLIEKPKALLRRDNIYEVSERIRHTGECVVPLNEEEVRSVTYRLAAAGVKAVAICFLHSYANPDHERRTAAILAGEIPGVQVSLSSTISPKWREYERTNTTVANAYIMPRVQAYLGKLRGELTKRSFGGALYVMQSNGGMATAEMMEAFPIKMAESGPAAGAVMASLYGRLAGADNVISFDMGGTTAKVCPIIKGRPGMTDQFEVGRVKMKRGSGLPLSIPAIDLIEIGAGGGSLAWGEVGLIRVGPESAGADPGPICYARGGEEPTVTDADLVLGYLNPEYFLGGELRLDVEAARHGINERVAGPLGFDVVQAAWAIHEVVNRNMAEATRAVSVERGLDPRDFALVAFGGAGPVHGARVARALGISRGIFPAAAGVASAIGLLAADVRFDLVRTSIIRLEQATLERINAFYLLLEEQGVNLLKEARAKGEFRLVRSADMRYFGQGYEVNIDVPNGMLAPSQLLQLRARFDQVYAGIYGFNRPEEPVEIVNWRIEAYLPSRDLRLPRLSRRVSKLNEALKGRRRVYFPETNTYVDCPIYDRYLLSPGVVLQGPAIVEERESTTVLLPGDVGRVDEYGNLIVTFGSEERSPAC